ncbi:MAG: exopolysaccharide biosynthesis protein [Betaproteobacteria bacterium]|nr:exopolysaccharide biosynthesis protein [Betaproteobacteria bacterium]
MNATLERIRALQVMIAKESPQQKEHHTFGEVLVFLEPIEFALAGLLLSTPFLQPVPLLGLSTPFGGFLALLGLFQILGRGPAALPRRIRDRKIQAETIKKILFYCEKLLLSLEKIPHWDIGGRGRALAHPRVLGWHVFFMGVLLALPLPIPFSNSIPAWGIVFSCLSAIETNGLFILFSYAFLLANIFFFGALVYVALQIVMSDGARYLLSAQGIEQLMQLLKNMF